MELLDAAILCCVVYCLEEVPATDPRPSATSAFTVITKIGFLHGTSFFDFECMVLVVRSTGRGLMQLAASSSHRFESRHAIRVEI